MNGLLLDTQAFLWFIGGDPRLSDRARQLIEDVSNDCFVSVASIWEIAIKKSLGRLELLDSLETLVRSTEDADTGAMLDILPIEASHAMAVEQLPRVHRDPFDRLLAATCLVEGWDIVSTDPVFDEYKVRRIA